MQEASTGRAAWTAWDWRALAGLVVFALLVRGWQLSHTEVAARDSIGFLRITWQLHEKPHAEWPAVLRQAEQHPGYPLAVLAVSGPVRRLLDGPLPWRMQVAAQLTSAVAAVLLVLPLYCLGRELFDRRVGLGLAALFQSLPMTGRLFSDGLSEALFLLFAASGFFWSVRALRSPSAPGAFALTGVFGGLAYLTRPEGALIVAATGLVLLAGQAVKGWRRTTRQVLVNGAALALPALALAMPFVAATGKLTVKPSLDRIRDHDVGAAPAGGGPALWAAWRVGDAPSQRVLWGLGVLGAEVVKGSFYVGWLLALAGLWRYRRRWRDEPGLWAMLLASAVVAYTLWRVAVVVGYLSDRHTLLILVLGGVFAVAELVAWGERLRWRTAALVLPLAFAAAGLPKTLQTLHGHRAGLRQAGLWLAENTQPNDVIVDALCWSHYYAGRVFLEGQTSWPDDLHLAKARVYVVVEDAGNPHPRQPKIEAVHTLASYGREVYCWQGRRGSKEAKVRVYRIDR